MSIFTIEAACGSNVGKIREHNEDNFYFNGRTLPQENQGVSIVYTNKEKSTSELFYSIFDGMGGEEAGEVAAFTAAQTAKKAREELNEFAISPRVFIGNLFTKMNKEVCRQSGGLPTGRMGTTVASILFIEDKVYVGNIGDSRIYRLRDKALVQVSEDHVEKIPIPGRKPRLTQFLGVDPSELTLEPYIAKADIRKGDTFLLCSDGLTDMLSNLEIFTILTECASLRSAVSKLIALANKKGGKDNITVLLCRAI